MPSNDTHAPSCRSLDVAGQILLVLRVNPDPCGGMNAHLFQDGEFLECRDSLTGVRADREAGLQMRKRAGADQLPFHVAQWRTVEAQLDEAWLNIGTADAAVPFIDPALRQCCD